MSVCAGSAASRGVANPSGCARALVLSRLNSSSGVRQVATRDQVYDACGPSTVLADGRRFNRYNGYAGTTIRSPTQRPRLAGDGAEPAPAAARVRIDARVPT